MSAAVSLAFEAEFVPDADFIPTTYEERKAYVKAHRRIPPALLGQRPRPWLVAPIVYPIIERNSRGKLGYCNATEKTLRIWAYEQTGHVYGERVISRRLRQAHRAGDIFRKRIPAGARFKTGTWSRNGTTVNRFPSEAERRERLAREKHARRRQRREAKARKRAERLIARPASTPTPILEARERPMPRTGLASMREFAVLPQGFLEEPQPTHAAYEAEFEALRAIQKEAARELAAQWAAEVRVPKPPD